MKPNFIVIGAPKAATTTLCAWLGQHPEIYMFPPKETHFFNHRFDRGMDWYESLFRPPAAARAVGEGTPDYTEGNPEVAARIATHLPATRLIYIVRQPLDRIVSHYVQELDNGQPFASFAQALRDYPPLLEASRYWARISEYRAHFPDDQILVLFFEDFAADPRAGLRHCCQFLGVDADHAFATEGARNARADKRSDRPVLRWLRRLPFYADLNWMLPRRLVDALKPVLRRKLDVDVRWDEPTRAWVLDELAGDACRFLEFYGKPPDFWQLPAPAHAPSEP